jgi:hypothetical protein
VLAAYKNVTGQAQNVAATPYSAYGGQLVSPVNAQQNTGIGAINQASGIQDPYNQGAGGLAGASSGAIDPSQLNASAIQQYESPYQSQVIAATQAQIQNQNQQQAASLQGNTIASGAFGGDRAGVAQAQLAGQQDIASNATLANLNNQNYMQALGTAQQQQGVGLGAAQNTAARQLAASQQLGALGQTAQTEALTGANAQVNAGTLQQTTQQAQDTAAYNQFLQQQAYPFQTTGWLANIVEGIGSQSGGTTAGQSTTSTSQLSQMLGLGAGIASFMNRGGRVPHRATGGLVGDGIYDPTTGAGGTGLGGGSIVPTTGQLALGNTMPRGMAAPQAAQTPQQQGQGLAQTAKSVQGLGNGLGSLYNSANQGIMANNYDASAAASIGSGLFGPGFARGGVPHFAQGGAETSAYDNIDPMGTDPSAIFAGLAPPPAQGANIPESVVDAVKANGLASNALPPAASPPKVPDVIAPSNEAPLPGEPSGLAAIPAPPIAPPPDAAQVGQSVPGALRSTDALTGAPMPGPAAQPAPNAPDPTFIRMVGRESGGNQFNADGSPVTSPKGALGIAQVMPGTGPEAAALAGLPWDPSRLATDKNYNFALGNAYYKHQLATFGSPDLAAAAYNAGPGAVQNAVAMAAKNGGSYLNYLPAETRAYVAHVAGGQNDQQVAGLGGAPTGGPASGVSAYAPSSAGRAIDKATQQQPDNSGGFLGLGNVAHGIGQMFGAGPANAQQASMPQYPDQHPTPEGGRTGLLGLNLSPETRQMMLSAGLGIMGGTSMSPLTNIGQGGLAGINSVMQQRNIAAEATLKTQQASQVSAEAQKNQLIVEQMKHKMGFPSSFDALPNSSQSQILNPTAAPTQGPAQAPDPKTAQLDASAGARYRQGLDLATSLYPESAATGRQMMAEAEKGVPTGFTIDGTGHVVANPSALSQPAALKGQETSAEEFPKVQYAAKTAAFNDARTGQNMLYQAQAMRDLVFDPKSDAIKLNTGPLGPTIQKVAELGSQAGVSQGLIDTLLHTDPNNGAALEKLRTSVGSESARADLPGSQIRVAEFQRYLGAVPNNEILPAALKYIIDSNIIPKAKQQIGAYDAVSKLDPAKDDLQNALFKYSKDNPWYVPGESTQLNKPEQASAQGAPQRPQNAPLGSQFSPSRQQWRTPSGQILNMNGAPVQ